MITGTTSGVGLNATRALVNLGWTVITANRSPQRAAAAADVGCAAAPAPAAFVALAAVAAVAVVAAVNGAASPSV